MFLRDVSPVHFERLLQFMYCGEVRVPNNELEDLLATATSLKVRGLANTHERCTSAGDGMLASGGGSGGPPAPLPAIGNNSMSPSSALLTSSQPLSRLNQQQPSSIQRFILSR